jgi:hypothetical protein
LSVGVVRYLLSAPEMLLNPFVFLSLGMSIGAVVFWFYPATSKWYQQINERAA